MSEFIREDAMYEIDLDGYELGVCPAHDFIHRFKRIGAHLLKYVVQEDEGEQMVYNLPITEAQAQRLAEECNLEILDRQFIGEQEYAHYLEWVELQGLEHLDFDVE